MTRSLEAEMKIEILHPIEHDHVIYSRGVRELPDDLAKLFLTYKHAARPAPEPATTTAAAPAKTPAPGPLPAAPAPLPGIPPPTMAAPTAGAPAARAGKKTK
jgi:hypothetical protein